MIYLDNAATTRPDSDALARAQEFHNELFYNPSARYGGGISVASRLKSAREMILAPIADPAKFDLVFLSGGTEGDNFAVYAGAKRGNAVTTEGEHAAVHESFRALKNRGVEPRFATLNRDGSVNADALLGLVDEHTSLVSVVHVNNETGAVNDISALARAVKKKNPRTIFHSDGVQAYCKLPVRLPSEVDLYTVSAHKIGGLKGTGALIKRKGLVLTPLLHGGGQEEGFRSGTENVFGAMVFAYAAEKRFTALPDVQKRLLTYREELASLLDAAIFTRISPKNGSEYILTVSAEGVRGEVLQRMLWDKGVVVGTGSACSSKHPHSRILQACGYGNSILDGVLRFSFSVDTTAEEITEAARIVNDTARSFKERL